MSDVRSEGLQVRRASSAPIRHFTDLIVWQRAHAVAQDVFQLSKSWPAEEKYALTDQIRRSSRSVGANIAEGWGKRRYEAAFVAKLVDADGEAHETEHWLITAEGHGYISPQQSADLRSRLSEVGRMLGAMIKNPAPFVTKR
ncbi:MAG: four helix bundle protein [Opitutaceae bacterium]|nr:four helix bundle protein [Cephaloticoccus sp.]MCP5531140.1 four helix bundle protein [Opitutaceae bacterium]